MKQLRKTFKKFSVVILVFALWGCTEVESLLPSVTADFTVTEIEGTGTVKFINTSEDASKYEWDFGDGTTSTEINPVKTYAATATYAVKLKAINTAGASDAIEKNITVEVPVIEDDPEGSIEACDGGDLVNDFETDDDSIFSNFGGGVGTIIDNPDTSVNTSAKIGQYVKGAGEVFAGITIE
ncbi:MAG: PKD domain-containing protein, partial [Eudoraea sp.]|nr:PKD domain-containing protein [Eudoraea sp.]NNK29941.1 PKD domain-containing protein [Flavobacteriaceae bacterium]